MKTVATGGKIAGTCGRTSATRGATAAAATGSRIGATAVKTVATVPKTGGTGAKITGTAGGSPIARLPEQLREWNGEIREKRGGQNGAGVLPQPGPHYEPVPDQIPQRDGIGLDIHDPVLPHAAPLLYTLDIPRVTNVGMTEQSTAAASAERGFCDLVAI